jgi:predicted ATPase/class 3 adenylate cyclase
MSVLPTGTVTLLFTDMEGSTRLLQQLGERYGEVWAEHQRLLRTAFHDYGGHEVDTQGDSFFVTFARATDAVQAAVVAQRALAAHPWPEGTAVRVRMGLHTGEPTLAGRTYVGLDVHRGARIAAAGHGGQVLLSEATRVLVERELPSGVSLRDLGEHRLKDLPGAEHVFQLVTADLPADFPPLRMLDVRPNNLPSRLISFVGRERETIEVKRLLGAARLLTLTGPGGSGKTSLALRVASELLDSEHGEGFANGVFFVALATISDTGLVVSTIAHTLGVREAAGRPLLDNLKDALREKQLLLVLDNFEQLLPAASLVHDLLATSPRLKFLVTSRAVLHLSGEKDYPVPPLALPEAGRELSAEGLSRYAAVALFVERALDAKPDFMVTDENASAAAEICARLDGLPLAIELAAARVRLLPPQALLARLARRLPLLVGGARDLPARQQTLRDTIAWSFDLLDSDEQALFCRLGVFVGGFTLEAAEAVCADQASGVEPPRVQMPDARRQTPDDLLDRLASLVDKSLLLQDEQQGEPRFRMLETIREYALEVLEASGEAAEIRRRHAEHFLALAEAAEPELHKAQQAAWLNRLEREHDNLRAAVRWSLERHEAELGLRLAGALGRFWEVRGFLSEGQSWLDRALALAVPDPPPAVARARAAALSVAGTLAFIRSDYDRAVALLQDSLTLRRELNDQAGIATSLHNLSRVRFYQGDHETAVALCEESLAVRRDLGDKRGVAMSLNTLGVIARNRGDQTAARTLLEESLALFRDLGDQWGIGLLLNNLARAARDLGDWTWTAQLCAESLALFREVGDRHGLAWVLSNLAIVAQSRGAWAQAARLVGVVEALRETLGSSALSLSPAERAAYEAAVATTRARLGDEAFAAAWAEGRALPLRQAIADALEVVT